MRERGRPGRRGGRRGKRERRRRRRGGFVLLLSKVEHILY